MIANFVINQKGGGPVIIIGALVVVLLIVFLIITAVKQGNLKAGLKKACEGTELQRNTSKVNNAFFKIMFFDKQWSDLEKKFIESKTSMGPLKGKGYSRQGVRNLLKNTNLLHKCTSLN